jgi:AcrR family transcriptional regulator
VDVIFSATAQILERDGLAGFNTNRIAERAGVSVGSLYQYFEDKDDILVGMMQREADRIRNIIAEELADTQARSLRSIVHALVYSFEGRQALRVALFAARPNLLLKYNQSFMEEISKLFGARMKLPDEAAFILTRVVGCILRQLALENRSFALDRLEDELVCLIEGYMMALKSR